MLKELIDTICKPARRKLSSAIAEAVVERKGSHYSVLRYNLENGYSVICVMDCKPGSKSQYIQDVYTPEGTCLDTSVFFINGEEKEYGSRA